MLRDLPIKAVYNSEDDNILEDFYIPALANSVSYKRAVGYFDAKMLISSARGLASFINNDGLMQLICGATLTEDEYNAIDQGYGDRNVKQRLESSFFDIIRDNDGDLFKNQLNALTWMIQHQRLDVKIALRKRGIHHQKIGIFTDIHGDSLIFQGSANETNNALLPFNYETINVFKSWQPEFKDHFEPHSKSFTTLWHDKARNTKVLDFSDITLKVLSNSVPSVQRPTIEDELALWQKQLDAGLVAKAQASTEPAVPAQLYGKDFTLRAHQKEALNNWQKNNYRGIFELATGAGKTITAIYGAVKIFENRKRLLLVISVPYQNLAEQWAENLETFNIKPIMCYGGEARWKEQLTEKILAFKVGLLIFCAVVVVDATLASRNKTFQNIISELGNDLSDYFLFIGDECHHHGAEKTALALPRNAKLRIGLSATPDRGEQDEGNDRIIEYYGEVVAQYTLKDALDDDVLTPYDYYPIAVELTSDETEEYIALSKQISRIAAALNNAKNTAELYERLNILSNQRMRLLNGCSNKPLILKNLLSKIEPIKHSLFYCAEGKVGDDDSQQEKDGLKQIELISSLLHDKDWRSSRFTANENKIQRELILNNFKNAHIHSLVAMKCLDEGVDIPACSTAFILASSRQPRQFVQRRGRILRKSPGKNKAVIYDFFVTLPLKTQDTDENGRKLLIAELKRIKEFSDLSLNKAVAYQVLKPYLEKYDIFHHL